MADQPNAYQNLKDFLEQENQFLRSNLYFKHNVEKSLDLSDDLSDLGDLPGLLVSALSWFMQGIVEEMERQEMTRLHVEASGKEGFQKIVWVLEGAQPSDQFMSLFYEGQPPEDPGQIEKQDLGVMTALMSFQRYGAVVSHEWTRQVSRITLTLPH